jgi:broad specificity phosphatase PhoE
MELILIRHGETDWNRETTFRGRIDIPLNANGMAQAEATARALRNKQIDVIYSSPLKRAMTTARIIAAPHGIEPVAKDNYIDIDYGIWQGLTESVIKERYPRPFEKWTNYPEKMRFHKGESVREVWKRCAGGLREIASTHDAETIAVVSHRIPIKLMTAFLLGKKASAMNQIKHDTCAISIFEKANREFKPILLNDNRHLSDLGIPALKDF